MKKILSFVLVLSALLCVPAQVEAFDWLRAAAGGVKAVQSMSISDAQVREYVHQYIEQLDSQSNIAPASSPYTLRLNTLTKGLTSVDGVPLNFKVYITNDVNAFACADGSVRVYSGLLDLMNDDEVLGVIGHEIGHVAKQHTKKAIKQQLLNSAIREGLASSSGWVGALSASSLGALGETLLSTNYSKKQENEADEYGYTFLKKAGKNPWAMAMAFSKLKSLEGTSSGASAYINKLFSDHPSTDARIKNMEQKARADKYPVPSGYTPMTK